MQTDTRQRGVSGDLQWGQVGHERDDVSCDSDKKNRGTLEFCLDFLVAPTHFRKHYDRKRYVQRCFESLLHRPTTLNLIWLFFFGSHKKGMLPR
jgi:hypothetical protein